MSRLDSFIRRLEAQRLCLGFAAERCARLPGVVLELGLGNGRTFDHLREICPGRDIYVFERQVAAHPDCVPAADRLFLGDFAETLPAAIARLGPGAACFVHVDLGSGDAAASRALAEKIAAQVVSLMTPGAVLVSDQPMADAGLRALPPPTGVKPGRYFLAERLA